MVLFISAFVFFLCLGFLFYVWVMFPALLFFFSKLFVGKSTATNPHINSNCRQVSVIIAAFNEQKNIEHRITNLLQSHFDLSRMEIIIASDGSTDNTNSIVEKIAKRNSAVRLIKISPQGGRANAHNIAVQHVTGDILIFSDAETIFEKNFVCNVVNAFKNPDVGYINGTLIFQNTHSGRVMEAVGCYWKYEMLLRKLESDLNIYIFGTGACCAVRKDCFKELPPTGDVDFTTPLDTVISGRKCLHLSDTIAYDVLPATAKREFQARVRMTTKNFHGILRCWGCKNYIIHPVYTWVILSHKIGRWLTPFALICLLVSNVILAWAGSYFSIFLSLQCLFYLLAFAGFLQISLPLANSAYSFCLANIAFFFGVIKAVFDRVPKSYRPTSQ